jgi:hypothetical protein
VEVIQNAGDLHNAWAKSGSCAHWDLGPSLNPPDEIQNLKCTVN